MSEHKVTTTWKRDSKEFTYQTYNRAHEWDFSHGVTVPVSAAVEYQGEEDRVDPEQAFTASLSSCHMLTFLALACQKQYVVDSYVDQAVGFLGKNDDGKMALLKVELHPKITFSGDQKPSPEDIDALHHKAHEFCFLANSVKTQVLVL